MNKLTVSIVLASMTAACVTTDADIGTDQESLSTPNGQSLNGVRLNGVRLNGVRLNGVRLNGVRLNGVRLNGVALGGANLDGSVLGAVERGVAVPERELIRSIWEGRLSNGTTLPLRIDSISRGEGANQDIAMYAVSYETTTGWQPLCEPNALGSLAIPVAGTWSYDQGVPGGGAFTASASDITLACRGTAIAKCVEFGYKPWKGLTDQLVTCTRALRADYCGDGTPYTADGTTINIYDNAGVQRDTEDWDLEAAWSPAGAVCIKRVNRAVEVLGIQPPCITKLRSTTCPQLKSTVLIKTELPPTP